MNPTHRKAIDEARKLNIRILETAHFVLALLAEQSAVSDLLVEHGITPERVSEPYIGPRYTVVAGAVSERDDYRGICVGEMNPDARMVFGRAQGLALAAGFAVPRPEDWLVALLYSPDGLEFATVLQTLGVSRPALVDALRQRGIPLPDVELPPLTRPQIIRHG